MSLYNQRAMNRRSFLSRTGMTAAAVALSDCEHLWSQGEMPRWRVFEITTQVRVLRPRGVTRVWLPTPLASAPYQQTMGDNYHPGGGTAVMIETNANEPDMLGCSWEAGIDPAVTLVSRVAAKDHRVAFHTPTVAPPPDLSSLSRFLTPTRLNDPRVTTIAETIGNGAGTDLERARALYQFTVTDAGELRRGEDPNELFVALCRAAGIPARGVYGLRLFAADATRAQHVRAEVYLAGFAWVPVQLSAPRPTFGSWDTNWIAYNHAQDVSLRGSARTPLAYFMHPQGETADGPIDSLDPERFTYTIAVQEATAATPLPANWL